MCYHEQLTAIKKKKKNEAQPPEWQNMLVCANSQALPAKAERYWQQKGILGNSTVGRPPSALLHVHPAAVLPVLTLV